MSNENTRLSENTRPNENAINVVLCWHMHQPQYQNQLSKEFTLPWTYLHAIKDYIDMATIIERIPLAKAVVNFTPVLLEQLEEYINQFDGYFREGIAFKEPLLDALSSHVISSSLDWRLDIIKQCIRANEKRIIHRFTAYNELVKVAKKTITEPFRLRYLNEQFYFDLMMWYHLAWLGETVRETNKKAQLLMTKSCNFSFEDRQLLLQVMSDQIKQVIPKYRNLAKSGQIELSFTPDKHPILPLLINFKNAQKPAPGTPIPETNYPRGMQRAESHIANGITLFERFFGFKPTGCWPAEGGLCEDTLILLSQHNIRWTASGGAVLKQSLLHDKNSNREWNDKCIHRAYQFDLVNISCFFRDDNLSDLIGFTYYDWNPQDAVNNMIHHIINIRLACGANKQAIVPIILDGENCWEHYTNNGIEFLTLLYQQMASHPDIHLTTFQEYLIEDHPVNHLRELVPGSWVYGNFSTWMGDPGKNRAWELLCEAKRVYDEVMEQNNLSEKQKKIAEHQLAICEGSDWFWWFGDYNPAEVVFDFDTLYRLHLTNLYKMLGCAIPEDLKRVISVGAGNPENQGVMRRSST